MVDQRKKGNPGRWIYKGWPEGKRRFFSRNLKGWSKENKNLRSLTKRRKKNLLKSARIFQTKKGTPSSGIHKGWPKEERKPCQDFVRVDQKEKGNVLQDSTRIEQNEKKTLLQEFSQFTRDDQKEKGDPAPGIAQGWPKEQERKTFLDLQGLSKQRKVHLLQEATGQKEERKPLYRICRGKKGNPAPEIYKDWSEGKRKSSPRISKPKQKEKPCSRSLQGLGRRKQ